MSPVTESPRDAAVSPPLISVVIPALEADVELRRCVDSIRIACSDAARCEVLVVLPPHRVEAAGALLPGVRLVPERRRGIYGAMNDGFAASCGRYLYFLGKDDVMLPQFRQLLAPLEARRPSALFFDVYWGTRGVYSGSPSRWRLLVRNLCHQGIVYSRDVLQRHGPYLRRMKVQADHLLNIRLLWDRTLRPRVLYVPAALAWYSGEGFSAELARDPVFWRLYPNIMRRYVGAWAQCLLVASRKLRGR